MKTFWLSFTDPDRPTGQQFSGVAVVDVEQSEADDALIGVLLNFPLASPGAEWIAAATGKAHAMGCNPGGQVMSMEMPREWPAYDTCPRNELLSKARLQELGLI